MVDRDPAEADATPVDATPVDFTDDDMNTLGANIGQFLDKILGFI